MTNLLLQLGVVCVAWRVATMVLASRRGAFLATLGFVLTPKAHPVAVLWPAARAELLMPNMPVPADGMRLRCAFTDGRIEIES